ncbi:MAG: hypothetical protein IKK98_07180, partial [Oscillospiraceae bacterium]|nr:hypothetical protein [Oscillospiraceae bacterium]
LLHVFPAARTRRIRKKAQKAAKTPLFLEKTTSFSWMLLPFSFRFQYTNFSHQWQDFFSFQAG